MSSGTPFDNITQQIAEERAESRRTGLKLVIPLPEQLTRRENDPSASAIIAQAVQDRAQRIWVFRPIDWASLRVALYTREQPAVKSDSISQVAPPITSVIQGTIDGLVAAKVIASPYSLHSLRAFKDQYEIPNLVVEVRWGV